MKTKCQTCRTEHEWDSCHDYYPTCESAIHDIDEGITAEYYICPCKTVLAVFVIDERGGSLYLHCDEGL